MIGVENNWYIHKMFTKEATSGTFLEKADKIAEGFYISTHKLDYIDITEEEYVELKEMLDLYMDAFAAVEIHRQIPKEPEEMRKGELIGYLNTAYGKVLIRTQL